MIETVPIRTRLNSAMYQMAHKEVRCYYFQTVSSILYSMTNGSSDKMLENIQHLIFDSDDACKV
jgi:hypothetical protein